MFVTIFGAMHPSQAVVCIAHLRCTQSRPLLVCGHTTRTNKRMDRTMWKLKYLYTLLCYCGQKWYVRLRNIDAIDSFIHVSLLFCAPWKQLLKNHKYSIYYLYLDVIWSEMFALFYIIHQWFQHFIIHFDKLFYKYFEGSENHD